MAKLVYICSAGHSGSTLLDIVVGSIPGAFSTGELTHLPWQLHRKAGSPQGKCSCGKAFDLCSVWSDVVGRLSERIGFSIWNRPLDYNISVINSQEYEKFDRVDTKIIRQFSKVGLVFNLWSVNEFLRRVCATVLDNNWLLFDTIEEVTKQQFIVDSSKDYVRMKFLSDSKPGSVYVLHLIRELPGVAYSGKKLGKDPYVVAKRVHGLNMTIRTVLKNMNGVRSLTVRYENVCQSPLAERGRIASFLGLPRPESRLEIDTHTRHLVAGNGMRHRGRLAVYYDDEWRKGLTPKEQTKIRALDKG